MRSSLVATACLVLGHFAMQPALAQEGDQGTEITAEGAPPAEQPRKSAETSREADPCASSPCVRAASGQDTEGPELKREPRDLTLQYPGKDPVTISPDAAGRLTDVAVAAGHLASKVAPVVGEGLTAAGEMGTQIVVPAQIVANAKKAYSNGGAAGAAASIARDGISEGAGALTAIAVSSVCGPVAGAVAGACAKGAAEAVMHQGDKILKGKDVSFGCAKVGTCKSSPAEPSDRLARGFSKSGGSAQPGPATSQSQAFAASAGAAGQQRAAAAGIDPAKLTAAVDRHNQALAFQQAQREAQRLADEKETVRERAAAQAKSDRINWAYDEAMARKKQRRQAKQDAELQALEEKYGPVSSIKPPQSGSSSGQSPGDSHKCPVEIFCRP